MTGNELRRLERSPSVAARTVHLNQFTFTRVLVVPAGPLSNAVGRLLIEKGNQS